MKYHQNVEIWPKMPRNAKQAAEKVLIKSHSPTGLKIGVLPRPRPYESTPSDPWANPEPVVLALISPTSTPCLGRDCTFRLWWRHFGARSDPSYRLCASSASSLRSCWQGNTWGGELIDEISPERRDLVQKCLETPNRRLKKC